MYGVKYIPHIVLVDQSGSIVYSGNPGGSPLDKTINDLLANGPSKDSTTENVSGSNVSTTSNKETQKVIDFVNSFKENHLKDLKYNPGFNFTYSTKGKFNAEGSELTLGDVSDVKVKGQLRKKEFDAWSEGVKKEFPDGLPKDVDNGVKEIETFDIARGTNCTQCQKSFQGDEGVYHCQWCNVSFCQDCTEKLNTEVGLNKLIHKEHNLLYFRNSLTDEELKNLDKYKLGKNAFKDVPESDLRDSHSAMCNGCNGGFKNVARYICVTCRPGAIQGNGFDDFCFTCIEALRNKEHEHHQSRKDNCKEHDHDHHVYLRLVHEAKNYYDF